MTAMSTFHPFPRLPYELRMQIWEMTVEPRTVHAEFTNPIYPDRTYYLTSSTPVPAVLQACREARNHGLYQKAFSEIAVHGRGAQYVWVDFAIDTIDIGTSTFDSFKPVAPLIQLLRFKREMQGDWFYYQEVDDVRHFVNAREIWIVPLDGLWACVGATETHYWPCGKENVFFLDPLNYERMFIGPNGEDEIDRLYGPKDGIGN
ncbi:hypothetical protein C7974DRAFT_209240 [Boeremia exigua]|uniref:uncharacterized protein n=1 Tax=Boeremia exigua TaxID=749465 RepID=UPI001E8E30E1|nr:uncharacterized protein C7974DRAFT_209240 [Boeremia exigua]KAH6625881.1 hypothetical protein C7974DRAFT_209240 [Boeremia exigua]